MEKIVYIEFYLAGDCIFACKKDWLPQPIDVDLKKNDLASMHEVNYSLITTAERTVELPITLPDGIMDGLLKGTGIIYRSNKLEE